MKSQPLLLAGVAVALIVGAFIGALQMDDVEPVDRVPSLEPASPEASAEAADHRAMITDASFSTTPTDTPELASKTLTEAPLQAPSPAANAIDLPSARAEVARLRDLQRCANAHHRASAKNQESRERHMWRWLPPDWAERERRGLAVAVARTRETCPPLTPGEEPSRPSSAELTQALGRAAQAGDIEAKMDLMVRDPDSEPSERDLNALRQHFYDALLSGDPERVAGIGRYQRILKGDDVDDPLFGSEEVLWNFVACELGRLCTAGSPMMERYCLIDSAACGASDYRNYIEIAQGPVFLPRIEARSRELVERIRSGQIAGLFDAKPEPPPGGG